MLYVLFEAKVLHAILKFCFQEKASIPDWECYIPMVSTSKRAWMNPAKISHGWVWKQYQDIK